MRKTLNAAGAPRFGAVQWRIGTDAADLVSRFPSQPDGSGGGTFTAVLQWREGRWLVTAGMGRSNDDHCLQRWGSDYRFWCCCRSAGGWLGRYWPNAMQPIIRWQVWSGRPADPVARLQLTEQQRTGQDLASAAQTARQLLAHEPLSGQAFRELGMISDQRGDRAQAKKLFDIAARRAPRDLPTHAWLAQYTLRQHDYPGAMQQFDIVFRQAPERLARLAPALVQMAKEPTFADALAASLRTNCRGVPRCCRRCNRGRMTRRRRK
ncbi:MAG: hypothetical protein U1F19_04015 [Lysobacterales bacterium]